VSPCQVCLPVRRNIPTHASGAGCGGSGDRSPRNSFRVPGLTREIRVKIATEKNELEQAFELLVQNYRVRGYEPQGDRPYRFTRYHALPGTVTLVALDEARVRATLSLVPDSSILGLPAESIYGPEVARLRADGFRPAEGISLADAGLTIREFIQVFKALIKLAIQYHARRGGDSWIITVNPRHSAFYQKVVGFIPLGPKRCYPAVQNHPAEAYLLTAESMQAGSPEMYQQVFGEGLPEPVLTAAPWSEEHVRYFGARSSQLEEPEFEDLLSAIARAGLL
jgi:hypothetical protein